MTNNKVTIAVLLGDPSGIGPELISKLLKKKEIEEANIVLIGERQILDDGDRITGNKSSVITVNKFEEIDFKKSNKFFLDVSNGKNITYSLSKCSAESGKTVLEALDLSLAVSYTHLTLPTKRIV